MVTPRDCTPPDDLPPVLVMMANEAMARHHPEKQFFLRVAVNAQQVDLIDLDGAITPIHARRLAQAMGYEPTHWIQLRDDDSASLPIRFHT